jgi:type IV secretion system protein TrbL
MQVPVIAIQMFGATLTIGAYVFLGGTLLITIVEAYLVSVFGLIMAGLSPLRTTHAFGTQKAIGYAISVGVKLLTLYLVIGLIQTVIAPIIAAAAAIPIAGALTVGFYGVILALIAYNVPTFAASIVSGIASGNASAGVSAMTSAAASATAMAQSMNNVSQGIHDKNDSKKLGSEADAKATSEKNMHGGTMEAKQPVATGLSGHEMPGRKSAEANDKSFSQNSVETKTGSPSAVAGGPPTATGSAAVAPSTGSSAPSGSGSSAATDKSLPQDSAGARAAAAQNLPAAPAQPSNGDPKKEDRRTTDQKLQDSYERGYGSKSKEPPDKATLEARAEFQQLRDQAYKEGDTLEKQGIDGFGKGIGQMLTPSGGAASGAVAGATLRSSV